VYDSFDKIGTNGQPYRRDTLSIAAVRAVNPHHHVLERIDALNEHGAPQPSDEDHPYTSFVEEARLPILQAIDVICSRPEGQEWKAICDNQVEKRCIDSKLLTDKVVLVGLAGLNSDLHETLIGKVAGVVLQANYVESLLTGRVFKPVSWWLQILIGLLWL